MPTHNNSKTNQEKNSKNYTPKKEWETPELVQIAFKITESGPSGIYDGASFS